MIRSRFAAVPGDQSDPFNNAALLARSPIVALAERKPIERLRRAVARLFRREPKEHPFDRWLRTRCDVGVEAEGGRETTRRLWLHWCAWTAENDINACGVPGMGYGMRGFGLALADRGVLVLGKNAKGLHLRGPIRLRPTATP